MGKRSPILGYNHNVRYRGLVFHVQSEDSGVATPHLFTHLFHSGVIVSTRKLVYDAGSAEESIKSLMQAQHKAVLKDLRRGHFDDKIDSYLGGTPGLLPRGAEDPGVDAGDLAEAGDATVGKSVSEATGAGEVRAVKPSSISEIELAPGAVEELAPGAPTEQVLLDELSAPVVIMEDAPIPSRPPTRSIPSPPPIPSRPPTTERALTPVARRTPAAVAAVDTTLRTEAPVFEVASSSDQSAEIEIQLEVDDDDEIDIPVGVSRRAQRDTETQLPSGHQVRPAPNLGDTKPTLGPVGPVSPGNEDARRASLLADAPGAVRSAPPPIQPADLRRPGDRPSTINASALPPARPIARPPSRAAVPPPQVVSRPLVSDDRNRRESEAVEVYSPALPSVELPPADRPGHYAQHRKSSTRIPIERSDELGGGGPAGFAGGPAAKPPRAIEGVRPDRQTSVPVPAGLGRPLRAGSPSTTPARTSIGPAGSPVPPSGPTASLAPAAQSSSPGSSSAVVPAATPRDTLPRSANQTEQLRARAPTPSRIASTGSAGVHSPAVSRTQSAGVVVTRPAVIVGAPTKSSSGQTVPRIRKAREDEGRGFGQGLISEKSLDEVILAYLSEDADEK